MGSQKNKEDSKKYKKKQEKIEAEERKKRNHELLKERIRKNREKEAAKEALKHVKELNGETFHDDISDDEYIDNSENTELVTLLKSITGAPTSEDNLMFAVPVAAPYSTMANYKYKVK